ncbi:hypothetical protein H4R20_000827 [Coemansia guatemalensis]|uniref:Uncharacterized protein n=1 Tax=Coemansia guatemalensis TaxID=2761395 RepID=A0A9W8I4I6_9FUNG|nr:hypothetical protein H4R20_000827 [Coemansia guatemalensis]
MDEDNEDDAETSDVSMDHDEIMADMPRERDPPSEMEEMVPTAVAESTTSQTSPAEMDNVELTPTEPITNTDVPAPAEEQPIPSLPATEPEVTSDVITEVTDVTDNPEYNLVPVTVSDVQEDADDGTMRLEGRSQLALPDIESPSGPPLLEHAGPLLLEELHELVAIDDVHVEEIVSLVRDQILDQPQAGPSMQPIDMSQQSSHSRKCKVKEQRPWHEQPIARSMASWFRSRRDRLRAFAQRSRERAQHTIRIQGTRFAQSTTSYDVTPPPPRQSRRRTESLDHAPDEIID